MRTFLNTGKVAMMSLLAALAVTGVGISQVHAQEEPAPPTEPAPAPAISDAQILSIVGAVNKMEITLGNIAEGKASGAVVKEYAETMVKEHTKVSDKVTSIMTALNLQPAEHPAVTATQERTQVATEDLAKLEGVDFDKAYINNQVQVQTDILSILDKTLIPAADNADVKNLLTELRESADAHLKAAQAIQASWE
ncbi:MAG: DUF4142 domain-containing protein [Bdellovibrionaceae bacterium]|nr:DUF4142 domain-containing protein [Pseudobdellovibrionaceae bacterium]MBX3033124.1 DUF4142 domain-containing protein [Pseudobdellovibrionaceae bacterium]